MLATYAVRVDESRGRRYPQPPHPYRNDFQRDRDRIIHSRAFRRLEAKTQVFTRRYSDHFRNRLTHTIEVAQISRTIAAQLGLNVDLVEALALVHDIGHPPFGHAGERALDTAMRHEGLSFDHNLHALRIVEDFELRYAAFRGLNLTFEVREGIIKHSRDYHSGEFPQLAEYLLDRRPPLEAQLIDITDELAYNTADLDDGYEARLLPLEDVKQGLPVFADFFAEVARLYPRAPKKLQFNEVLRRILDRWVGDLIENTLGQIRLAARCSGSNGLPPPAAEPAPPAGAQSRNRARNQRHRSPALPQPCGLLTEEAGPETDAARGVPRLPEMSLDAVRAYPERLVRLSPEIERERRRTKEFLYQTLYFSPALQPEKGDAERIITDLFELWMKRPERLPPNYQEKAKSERLARVVCDYIAGMTDNYIYEQHRKHCG